MASTSVTGCTCAVEPRDGVQLEEKKTSEEARSLQRMLLCAPGFLFLLEQEPAQRELCRSSGGRRFETIAVEHY